MSEHPMTTIRTPTPYLGDCPSLRRSLLHTPIGTLTLIASVEGVRAVLWPGELDLRTHEVAEAEPGSADPACVVLRAASDQLGEYFAGARREFDLPLDPQGTAFQVAAWAELRRIPYGGTISYGEQARRLGDPKKARAVGAANGRNPLSIVVPCHRVVGADGSLTGFAGGVEAKRWLLRHEQAHST